MDVALVTCRDLPDLDADDATLRAALVRLGVTVEAVVWDDPGFDWSGPRALVLRSTWDYFHRRAEFVAWAERAGAGNRLWNSARVVRWNTHKHYLRDLEARGVRVVETAWIDTGASVDIAAIAAARGWSSLVVKPAVSGNAYETARGDAAALQAHASRLARTRDVMVQPYLAAVEGRGERSLVFIGGELSHAIRKNAVLAHAAASPATPHEYLGGEPRVEASEDEVAFARRALDAARAHTECEMLYARVDLVEGADGALALMELELVEPSLFLRQGDAAGRLADAIVSRLV